MKVIIIGGIAAGMSAAAKLKRSCPEAEVIIYEKSPHISFGACGLPYYVGGFFDNKDYLFARTPEAAAKSGIQVYTEHEVLSINPEAQTLQVKNLKENNTFTTSYDQLMIATGASAIIPPIQNRELKNVHTLRSMEDGEILREKLKSTAIQKVGIIGAGFIGLEAVEAAKVLGKEVYLFQLEDRILKEAFDPEITTLLEAELKLEDVQLYLNTKVVSLLGEDKVTGLIAQTPEGEINIALDLVILATGVKPNTSFTDNTSIQKLPNGAIIINKEGQTSIPNIYAAGDCATVPHLLKETPAYIPLATSANKLGRIVGENLAGKHIEFEGTLGSSCLKMLHMEAGRTGLSEQEATSLGIAYSTSFITDKNQTNYYPGQESLSIKLIYEKDSHILLGGQVVGKKDAVQRTNVLAAAIYSRMTTKQLGMLDLCYAPPFARTWDALNIAGNASK